MRNQMIRLRHAVLAAGLSGSLLLLAAGSAAAGTTIGQNDAGGTGTCGAGNTFIQTGTGPGAPSYTVPAGGGVITSWSFQAGSTAGEQDKLKVVRPTETPNQFFVVGEGALQTMTPSTLNTFPVRIPVQAGDLLGLHTVDGNDCTVTTHTTGNTDAYVPSPDPSPGSTFTGTPESSSGEAYNVSARVEADADDDGWGDETQDKCVGATGPMQGCPRADLSVANAASAGSVLRGRNVTYTLTVTNSGPDAAPSVAVEDALPAGATLVSATASGGSCVAAPTIVCTVGTLASGASATVALVVRMTSIGVEIDTATVDSATLDTAAQNVSGAGDTNSANNSASATTGVLGISNATQSHKRWREPRNPKRATLSKKRPAIGTTFKFDLGGPTKVRIAFTQPAPGRKVHGKCVATTSANKNKHKCARTVPRGHFNLAGRPGLNTVRFQGRVSASRKLKPGTYTVIITAITPGLGSTSTRLTFTIVS
jgi:uncharacterized repeat protein (TIGR01451 family)